MQGEMTRGRSQVIWRYMINAIFRYNDDNAWCIVKDVRMSDKLPLDGVLANALFSKLTYWRAISDTGFPNPMTQSNKYIVGEPHWIHYDLWPTVFRCRKCNRMQWYQNPTNLKQRNDLLRCRNCGQENDILVQTPFAYVCECGNIETIFVPRCPNNDKHSVVLVDRRSFQDSYWYCQDCNIRISSNARSGLGIRACQCGKTMRGVILIDPRIYYSQTMTIVDIQPKILEIWNENENFNSLLLGAAFQIPCYKKSDIHNLSKYKAPSGENSPEIIAIRDVLKDQGLSPEQIDDIISKSIAKSSDNPWNQYKNELSECSDYIDSFEASENRQTIEYVFVKDEPSVVNISLNDLIKEAQNVGDDNSVKQFQNDQILANSLGLTNVSVVQELPLLLAGIGYTRYYASPIDYDGNLNDTQLRPYKFDSDGKIPIYVAKNKTEGLFYELDPWRIASFLDINNIVNTPDTVKKSQYLLKAWLHSITSKLTDDGESHLKLMHFEEEQGKIVDKPSAIIFGLLHSVSHILMVTAHQYVGIDKDALAEYLFPAYSSGIVYASSHVEFTLGGIDAVFRSSLEQWLGTAKEFANNCSFDPVCSDDGGACMACLYTKFGCNYFNRSLSRAYLFGGSINGFDNNIIGFWSKDVTDATKLLKKNAGIDI